MLGVTLGILLLLFLIALVVLQGMIEWGNFDIDKFFGKKAKPQEIAKEEMKTKKVSSRKKAKPAKKKVKKAVKKARPKKAAKRVKEKGKK